VCLCVLLYRPNYVKKINDNDDDDENEDAFVVVTVARQLIVNRDQ